MFNQIDTMAFFMAVKTAKKGDTIKMSDYEIKKGENKDTSENK